jgi:hypothetical protein
MLRTTTKNQSIPFKTISNSSRKTSKTTTKIKNHCGNEERPNITGGIRKRWFYGLSNNLIEQTDAKVEEKS